MNVERLGPKFRLHHPTEAEAIERLDHLRRHGSTPHAFGFRTPFQPHDSAPQPADDRDFGPA